MQIIDNINHIVKNDLQDSIQPGSKLSIAAAYFSIYAYQELKKQIAALESKMRREKQLNRRMEMNAEFKKLQRELGGMK